MALGAFATINTSSATIVNNHKHARDGRRDDFDAKRDGRQDGHRYLTIGRVHILRSAHHIVLHILILFATNHHARDSGGSQRLAARAISAMLHRGKEMRRDDGEIKYV